MSTYHAPLQEMTFVLNELAGLAQVASLPGFEEAVPDTVAAILEEAAKFATNVLDPLNSPGDREGATRLPDGSVKTPAGFKEAYRQFIENGWNGLTKNPEYGGQGLPQLVATPVEEMWHSANMAFDLCPLHPQRAGGRQRHFAFHRAEISGERRRIARRAQRCAMRVARAQAWDSREPHGGTCVW